MEKKQKQQRSYIMPDNGKKIRPREGNSNLKRIKRWEEEFFDPALPVWINFKMFLLSKYFYLASRRSPNWQPCSDLVDDVM